MEATISFRDVRVGFEEGDIVRGLSFEVFPKETLVLLGETGTGKTLSLKMAAGLLRPLEGDITVQTRRVLENLKAVVEAAGSSLERAVKATVFLKNIGDFAAMNDVYAEYLGKAKPARSTVAVTELPRGALVEIDLVAIV